MIHTGLFDDPLIRLYCVLPGERVRTAGMRDLIAPGALTVLPSQGSDPIEPLLATLVTPLALISRVALDRYGVLLGDPYDPRFEVDGQGRPTGRVALARGPLPARPSGPAWFARLARTLHELGAAFSRDAGADPLVVHQRIEQELADQFRFPGAQAAAALALRETADQDSVLTEVLRRVEEKARRRRADASLPPPAVMVDVDLCALVPRGRAKTALREVGERLGIEEFCDIRAFETLPTYHLPSWNNYLSSNSLRERYTAVDFNAAYELFYHAFFNPWDRLRTDTAAPGLARFVWDVYDVGGRVVFHTGRRERVRPQTEDVLARAGIAGPRLAMLPNDRTRPVHELKAEKLEEFADLDIVAVFDDLCENRLAMGKRLPEALFVAVELPGFAVEHAEGAAPDDGAPVVAGFERTPDTGRTRRAERAIALSDTRSLAEVNIGALSDHRRAAARQAATLTERESRALVARLLENSLEAADRVGSSAREAMERSGADTAWAIHHILTRDRFRKGPRGYFPLEKAAATLRPRLADGAPIPVATLGFPVKLHYNGLKTAGLLPDLAELASLVRLLEVRRAIGHVYPPGLRITVLTDGSHFTPRPAEVLRAYHDKLDEYHRLVDASGHVELTDVEHVAHRVLGADSVADRGPAIEEAVRELDEVLGGIDVDAAVLPALETATQRAAPVLGDRAGGTPMPGFADLYRSMLYVVPLTPPPTTDLGSWARLVYADVLGVADPDTPAPVRSARREVLAAAWRRTVRYLAVLRVDRDRGYDDFRLLPGCIRFALNPRPGALGFGYLGGSGVLPWHATAAIDRRGQVSTDFAVSLCDAGFVPVHSPLLGADQPWFTVPSTAVDRGRLDPGVIAGVRLRRR